MGELQIAKSINFSPAPFKRLMLTLCWNTDSVHSTLGTKVESRIDRVSYPTWIAMRQSKICARASHWEKNPNGSFQAASDERNSETSSNIIYLHLWLGCSELNLSYFVVICVGWHLSGEPSKRLPSNHHRSAHLCCQPYRSKRKDTDRLS